MGIGFGELAIIIVSLLLCLVVPVRAILVLLILNFARSPAWKPPLERHLGDE
jgi:hypothetical protein